MEIRRLCRQLSSCGFAVISMTVDTCYKGLVLAYCKGDTFLVKKFLECITSEWVVSKCLDLCYLLPC